MEKGSFFRKKSFHLTDSNVNKQKGRVVLTEIPAFITPKCGSMALTAERQGDELGSAAVFGMTAIVNERLSP